MRVLSRLPQGQAIALALGEAVVLGGVQVQAPAETVVGGKAFLFSIGGHSVRQGVFVPW